MQLSGKYRLQGHIPVGEGGFATVYRGTNVETGDIAAVKILREEYESRPDILASFFRDAENARSLTHDHIIRIFDVGQPGENPSYFAMEFCGGGDLRTQIRQQAWLPITRVLQDAIVLCNALSYCHQRGLRHGDLKASNILYRENDVPVLTDFGNAVRESAGQDEQQRINAGSPPYMSPEVWEGRTSEIASDLYSFGVLLYYSLSGVLPYSAGTSEEYRRMHLHLPPRPPSLWRPTINRRLDEIVLSLLEKRPGNRPASAEKLATELDEVLKRSYLEQDHSRNLRAVLHLGDTESQGLTLRQFPFRIGSASTAEGELKNDLVLGQSDPFISRFHASIDRRSEGFAYTDASRNGSVVNGVRVHRRSVHLLKENIILMGRSTQAIVRVDHSDDGAAVESTPESTEPGDRSPGTHASVRPTLVTAILVLTVLSVFLLRLSCA